MAALRPNLPYANGSNLNLNQIEGTPIFDAQQLAWIEARTGQRCNGVWGSIVLRMFSFSSKT